MIRTTVVGSRFQRRARESRSMNSFVFAFRKALSLATSRTSFVVGIIVAFVLFFADMRLLYGGIVRHRLYRVKLRWFSDHVDRLNAAVSDVEKSDNYDRTCFSEISGLIRSRASKCVLGSLGQAVSGIISPGIVYLPAESASGDKYPGTPRFHDFPSGAQSQGSPVRTCAALENLHEWWSHFRRAIYSRDSRRSSKNKTVLKA
jgi:hypothetical protein